MDQIQVFVQVTKLIREIYRRWFLLALSFLKSILTNHELSRAFHAFSLKKIYHFHVKALINTKNPVVIVISYKFCPLFWFSPRKYDKFRNHLTFDFTMHPLMTSLFSFPKESSNESQSQYAFFNVRNDPQDFHQVLLQIVILFANYFSQ